MPIDLEPRRAASSVHVLSCVTLVRSFVRASLQTYQLNDLLSNDILNDACCLDGGFCSFTTNEHHLFDGLCQYILEGVLSKVALILFTGPRGTRTAAADNVIHIDSG